MSSKTDSLPPQDKSLDELKEKLAAIEHERWSDWQKWCHSVIRGNIGANVPLEEVLARWDRQINTPYTALTDQEQASDMEQVDRYWPLVEKYISSLLKQSQAALIQRIREEVPNIDSARNSDMAEGERYMVQVFLEALTKLERELDE